MTEEKLKRGEDLIWRINRLEGEKKKWSTAQYISRVTLCTEIEGPPNTMDVDIISNYIDFDSLKALTLASIEKSLAELQKEFNEL